MRVQVETYSGFQADERPLRFTLGDKEYRVEEMIDKWYGPQDTWYKVRTDDGGLYVLRLDISGAWTLESYRATPAQREQGPVPPD